MVAFPLQTSSPVGLIPVIKLFGGCKVLKCILVTPLDVLPQVTGMSFSLEEKCFVNNKFNFLGKLLQAQLYCLQGRYPWTFAKSSPFPLLNVRTKSGRSHS